MDQPPLASIPRLILHDRTPLGGVEAQGFVDRWLSKLLQIFQEGSFETVPSLFIEDCWWRDIVGLSWDFSSKHGHQDIAAYLKNAPNQLVSLASIRTESLKAVLLDIGGMVWIQAGFEFKTSCGRGRGIVKLANVEPSQWRAWSVFSQLESLDVRLNCRPCAPDLSGTSIDDSGEGVKCHTDSSHVLTSPSRSESVVKNCSSQNEARPVVIVGAGQSGLALGARLKEMGISPLLIEKHKRLGDSWRHRYESIRLHTPCYTDSYPYLDFPEGWPQFPSRDMIADFAEHYGHAMELDVWLDATVSSLLYDRCSRTWELVVHQAGSIRVLRARHVVLATGVYADKPLVPTFPGQPDFEGRIYHSSEHQSARYTPDIRGTKVVVVGAGPSAHDVAQDFVNHGAKSVSMVQRSPIFSMSMEAMERVIFFLWNLPGMSTGDADLIGNATPIAVIRAMSIGMTKAMCEYDRNMIAGLQKAGLALRLGDDGYGVADHQLIKGGQFYIDQGANQMIIDGQIRIYNCQGGVKHFGKTGLVLSDGTCVGADVVVLATGYHHSDMTVGNLLGTDVAKQLVGFGHLDEEQERSGWWRKTGVPGFWYMTGSFMWSRQFSLSLALQIAAVEYGLNKSHFEHDVEGE